MVFKTRIARRASNKNRPPVPDIDQLASITPTGEVNQKGFVTTMALTVLPFVVMSALCVLGSVWFVEQKEHVQWLCEKQNTDAQKKLVDGMSALLALNPKIEGLVIEKKWVKQMMKIPSSPAEKAALAFRLITINIELTGLMTQQKARLASAQWSAEATLAQLRRNLAAHVSKMERQWRTSLNVSFHASRARIRLRRKKIDSLGYLYLEHPLLAAQQKINVKIAISGERLFPKWLQWISPNTPLLWTESCSAKPHKEINKWVAKLHLDKF